LVPLIYHERQEEGSMLCAQHALNNLLRTQSVIRPLHLSLQLTIDLQRNFSAPDLSAIARGLDELEQSYHEDRRRGSSTNMDDTGFFSLQVLQKALEVWSLSLVSWRSEEMSKYTSHPHTQLAFVLNLNEHWFTLRRFGAAPNSIDDLNPGQGHWFNLNSFLRKPEWVGKLYLSMVLQQSEQEGYSVFVIKRMDPTQKTAIPETEADRLAARLPDPSGGSPSLPVNSSHTVSPHAPGASRFGHPDDDVELQAAMEDRELQAALQASLMSEPSPVSATQPFFDAFQPHSNSGLESPLPLPVPPPLRGSSFASPTFIPVVGDPEVDPDLDPVAASVARNRLIMERTRREQEMAFRDTFEDVDMEDIVRRTREMQEEEDMLKRAIEESEKLAVEVEERQRQKNQDNQQHAGGSSSTSPARVSSSLLEGHRVYDDEDAELQAALRASLQDLPPGYQ
ncbi:Josephin-domain-containing protein, partial [Thelephora ganbajun]